MPLLAKETLRPTTNKPEQSTKGFVEGREPPVETCATNVVASAMLATLSERRSSMAYAIRFAVLSLALAAPASIASAAPAKAPQDQQKYCLQYEGDTGSRINHVECKTKAEWARLGIDVDELSKK
jgi:hypothetical protein